MKDTMKEGLEYTNQTDQRRDTNDPPRESDCYDSSDQCQGQIGHD